MKHHPDKNNETEETRQIAEKTFKEINEAHSILSDPEKRKRFDVGGDEEFDGHGNLITFKIYKF